MPCLLSPALSCGISHAQASHSPEVAGSPRKVTVFSSRAWLFWVTEWRLSALLDKGTLEHIIISLSVSMSYVHCHLLLLLESYSCVRVQMPKERGRKSRAGSKLQVLVSV